MRLTKLLFNHLRKQNRMSVHVFSTGGVTWGIDCMILTDQVLPSVQVFFTDDVGIFQDFNSSIPEVQIVRVVQG